MLGCAAPNLMFTIWSISNESYSHQAAELRNILPETLCNSMAKIIQSPW